MNVRAEDTRGSPPYWVVLGEVLHGDGVWREVTLEWFTERDDAVEAATRLSYAEKPKWRRLRVAPFHYETETH